MASWNVPRNRSRLENVFNYFPQGHEKPLKHALYNVAALCLVLVGAVGFAVIYFILGPFLRPLLWAVLCGSVLHPFKQNLTTTVRKWLNRLKATGTPLTLGLLAFPVGVIDQTAEKLGNIIIYYAKALMTVTIILITITLIYILTPVWFIQILIYIETLFLKSLNGILSVFSNIWVWTIIACHFLVIVFYWKPETSSISRQLAIPIWIVIFLHLVAITGPFRIPLFFLLVILMVIGLLRELKSDCRQQEQQEQLKDTATDKPTSLANSNTPSFAQNALSSLKNLATSCESFISEESSTPQSSTKSTEQSSKVVKSNMYLWSVAWACVLVQFYHHTWILPLFALPIWYFAIKHSGQYLGFWSSLTDYFLKIKSFFLKCFEERKDALIPPSVKGLFILISKGDVKILNIVDNSLDTVVSLSIVILVVFCILLATIFFVVQIHAESMHLVHITSNLINRTVVNNPQLRALLPDNLTETADSMFDNLYIYGREWSANLVKNFIGESDTDKALQIEKQVHEIVDKLYRIIDLEIDSHTDNINQAANHRDIGQSLNKLVEGLSSPGVFDFTKITEIFKENIGTFLSVLDGVWNVVKGNISLVLNATTAILSVVFNSGTAILNFFVNLVVFFTALFYLLTTSREQYKFTEFIGRITPTGAENFLVTAIESAITDVFTASFKMAIFYGMWTWLIHNLSGVKIVYLPSAVAAILGALPILGTYWAVFPAVLELWLIQDSRSKALLMFGFQVLPVSFVDSAIYGEIKGGGPYLTALAIAGGIFCLGAEGAIIGPIILCCLYFVINMTASIMQESTKESQSQLRSRQLRGSFSRTSSVL